MNYDEYLLESYRVAQNSPDPSTQNGAVLLQEDSIIAVGWNDFPAGVDPEYWTGPKEAKYARVVHAETSVLLAAARLGRSTVESTMVCAWAACSNCAKHMAAAGVARLVRHSYANSGADTGSHWYEDCLIGDEIFRQAGIEIVELEPVETNIQLRRNGALWPTVLETADA